MRGPSMRSAPALASWYAGIVQYGKDIVEHVFYSCTQAFEIALRGTRQIGATLYSVDANSEAVLTEPRRGRNTTSACSSEFRSPMLDESPVPRENFSRPCLVFLGLQSTRFPRTHATGSLTHGRTKQDCASASQ